LICIGKGNEEWNFSAPHGAGRIMSRSQAFKEINMSDFKSSMNGIYSETITEETKDEAPMVYKPMDEIIKNRIEFTKQVKGAFCYEQDGKTLTVTYKSTATPIDYRCVGNQFGTNNEINKINPGVSPGGSISVVTVDNTKMVGNFQIIGDKTTDEVVSNLPTLTFEGNNYKNYDECNNKNNLQYKLPYYFGIRDNNKNTLPSKGNEIGGIGDDGHFQAVELDIIDAKEDTLNVSKMFGVHIYNKPMYLKVKRYWTGFKNYNYNGDYIDLPGFLRADVVNGIVNPQVNISDKTVVLYKIVDNDYTNTEVERYIYTDNSQSDKLYYGQYQISNGNNNDGTDIPDSEGGDEGVNGGITPIDNDSNSTNSNNLYQYIEINNTNNKTVVISDGYCSDYETELNFDFSVNVDNTYFTYREDTNNNQYLDYINLNVNNAPSSNMKHYLFEYKEDNYIYNELYDRGENDKKSKWDVMPEFFQLKSYNDVNLGYKTSSTSNRITIPKLDNKVPKELSKQFFVLSVCDNKYYTLSPVIDYTPIRCFALHKESENAPINKTIIYLTSNIKNGEEWQSIDTIHYLEKYGFKITKPQYNDVLANQIDFEYRDIYTQNIETPTFVNITINSTTMKAIKITFDPENEMADWHQIDVIDIIGIRRHCIIDHNSIITETPIQQTSNE
jgi:hypothetical protein